MSTTSPMSSEASGFSWLLDNFVRTVPGVRHTLVVSADGLLMAMSDGLDRTSGIGAIEPSAISDEPP